MDEWFVQLAEVESPSPDHLVKFVDEVMRLLAHILRSEGAGVLWQDNPDLRELAIVAFREDVVSRAEQLRAAIHDIPQEVLVQHGLIGSAARFKYNVMATVSRGWGTVRRHFTIRGGFRRIVDAVDAHLDSLIAATGGVGGVIKEFKDALLALAPEQ
jgi:hypothetical protein